MADFYVDYEELVDQDENPRRRRRGTPYPENRRRRQNRNRYYGVRAVRRANDGAGVVNRRQEIRHQRRRRQRHIIVDMDDPNGRGLTVRVLVDLILDVAKYTFKFNAVPWITNYVNHESILRERVNLQFNLEAYEDIHEDDI